MYTKKELLMGWNTFKQAKYSFLVSVLGFVFLLTLLAIFQNGKVAFQAFSFDSLSFFSQLFLFFKSLFSLTITFSLSSLLIAFISSILGGLSIAMAYEYFAVRKQAIDRSSTLLTSVAYIFVVLGIHCATCGIIFLGLFISIFGAVLAPQLLMYTWVLGVVGVLVQMIVIYLLLGKLSKALTC